jgi:hypothetical protein
MDAPTSRDLSQRLDRLERQARSLRWSVIALLVVSTVMPVLIARAASDKVSGSEFTLRDAAGRERGVFWLFGEMPTFVLHDRKGKPRLQFDLLPDDSPRFFLADADQRIRAKLKLAADGSPLLEMLDNGGKVIWSAP